MIIVSNKFQLQSFQLDNFSMSLDSDKLELVERAKYLGLYVKIDLSWDEHILKSVKMWTVLFMFFVVFAEYFPEYCY